MNAEPHHLASAYLDGDLTDEERRRAELDPAVMAEVESFRALRDRIASVEPPSPAARDSAISAAMTAFHQLHGAADPARADARPDAAPDVVPFRRRPEGRDLSKWLGVAAALVVAAALGIVAVQARGGSDDSAADEAVSEPEETSAARVPQADDLDATAGEPAEEPADELMAATEVTQDDAVAEDAGGDAESALADAAEAAPAEEQSMTAEATAEESASEDLPATVATTTTTSGPTTVPLPDPARYFEDGLPIESPVQLQSAALYLIDRRDAGELGATPEYRCPFAFVLERAVYRVGTTDFDVLIDVDESNDIVSAVDEPTCNVIAESPITADDEP